MIFIWAVFNEHLSAISKNLIEQHGGFEFYENYNAWLWKQELTERSDEQNMKIKKLCEVGFFLDDKFNGKYQGFTYDPDRDYRNDAVEKSIDSYRKEIQRRFDQEPYIEFAPE